MLLQDQHALWCLQACIGLCDEHQRGGWRVFVDQQSPMLDSLRSLMLVQGPHQCQAVIDGCKHAGIATCVEVPVAQVLGWTMRGRCLQRRGRRSTRTNQLRRKQHTRKQHTKRWRRTTKSNGAWHEAHLLPFIICRAPQPAPNLQRTLARSQSAEHLSSLIICRAP